jgi:hypothetical protein
MDMTATYADPRHALDAAVAQELRAGGELESQTDSIAVIRRGGKVNHILHLILSILTAGIWLFVWLLLVLTNKRQRVVLSLDHERQTIQRTVTTA